jgi:tRNA nucleotidyltransferase (CCA-adding enzyme)
MKIYAVGGAIRDTLMGLPVHDIDYVVVGSSVDEMLAQGFRPVGKDFPVFLHPSTQAEYALARTERKTGKGYKGFMFHADPSVTLEQDLERRDLTINAMAQEVREDGQWVGPILDPFNGQQDLAARVFRHVSDAFAEDPLRLLRIARFAARFPNFIVASETMAALQAIVRSDELAALSPERIWQELAKGLTARNPMHMFQVLLDSGAANVLLPTPLAISLSKDEFRKELIDHLHASDARLEDRCAVTLMHLSASEIRSWAQTIRMPHEVRDFSEIFCELYQLIAASINSTSKSYLVVDVLTWFNRADVWRKPERAHALLDLAKRIQFDVSDLTLALQKAQSLNTANIIESIPAQDRSNGECIRSAVDTARLSAIASVLNT